MTGLRSRRPTKQRIAIESDLDRVEEFRTAQEIHASLHAAGDKIGLATVYRTLQALAEAGEVDVLRTDDGEALYRRCESVKHHHHLVCRQCGTTVEISGGGVETWAEQMAAEHGFTDLEHIFDVFGLCAECSQRQSRA